MGTPPIFYGTVTRPAFAAMNGETGVVVYEHLDGPLPGSTNLTAFGQLLQTSNQPATY